MASTIKIPNFGSLNIVEKSELNADAAAAATTLTVAYTDDMSANDYLYIGHLGTENGEVKLITSVDSKTQLTVPALDKGHSRFDPLTILFGNQFRVYRASNVDGTQPADGDFSLLTTQDLDYDQNQSEYNDSSGSSSYWYKFTYYNETSTDETALADSTAVRGGGVGNYASIESIRRTAGLDQNQFITDAYIEEKRQAAQNLINATLQGIYTLPFSSTVLQQNPIIGEITRRLAGGYLLTADYGPLNTLNTNEGKNMIDSVTNADKTGLLDRLNAKDLVLVDESGASVAIAGSGDSFKAFPDANTKNLDADQGGGPRMFNTGAWQEGERMY